MYIICNVIYTILNDNNSFVTINLIIMFVSFVSNKHFFFCRSCCIPKIIFRSHSEVHFAVNLSIT